MKSTRYTPEQVAFGLRQAEEGTPVSEVCRKMGVRLGLAYGSLAMTNSTDRHLPLCSRSKPKLIVS